MGVLIISTLAGLFGSYLAYKAIGTDRLWELILAIGVGGVFGYTISLFAMTAVASLLVSGAYNTEAHRTEIPVAAFTSQVTNSTYYTSESEDGKVVTIRPTKGATSRYSYIDGVTGELEEVPARNTVLMVNESFDNTLIIVSDRFKKDTWTWVVFGDSDSVRERIFRLSERP